jgi:hypothetical protein
MVSTSFVTRGDAAEHPVTVSRRQQSLCQDLVTREAMGREARRRAKAAIINAYVREAIAVGG